MKPKILFIVLILIIAVMGASYFMLHQAKPPAEAIQVEPDYDRYAYGRSGEKVIDFGTQPNATNLAFTNECLLHDRILQQQLAAEGWMLREHPFRNGPDNLRYADGRLDLMILGDIPTFTALQRHGFGVFAFTHQGNNAVLANRWYAPAELKGLRIGYPAGTSAHFTLERALATGKLEIGDIVSVPMHVDEMTPALLARRVDAIATWTPLDTLSKVPGSVEISSSNSYSYFTMSLDFAARHPSLQKAVLAAVLRATRWARQDQTNLYRSLEWIRQGQIEFMGASAVKADAKWAARLRKETIDNPSFPLLPLNFADEQGYQHAQFVFMKKAGLLPAGTKWQDIAARIDLDLLPEIIRDSESWRLNEFDYAEDKLYR